MLGVRVFHATTDIVTYLDISVFFRLVGFQVYDVTITTANKIQISDFIVEDDYINFAIISDKLSKNKFKKIYNKDVCYISNKDEDIIYNEYYLKQEGIAYRKEFFKKVIEYVEKHISEKEKNILNFRRSIDILLDMYIDKHLLRAVYISERIPKKLIKYEYEEILKIYDEVIKDLSTYKNDSPIILYEYINLNYLVNKMVIGEKGYPRYSFEEIEEEFPKLSKVSILTTSLLMGNIYGIDRKNTLYASYIYSKQKSESDYYKDYVLGKYYEERIRNLNTAVKYYISSYEKNKMYFRAIYKIAVYYKNIEDYEKSLKFCQKMIDVLIDKVEDNYMQPLDVEYILKTFKMIDCIYSKLLETKVSKFQNSINKIKENLDNNKFLNDTLKMITTKDLSKDIIKIYKENF